MCSEFLTLRSRLATKSRVSPFPLGTVQPGTSGTSRETWLTFGA